MFISNLNISILLTALFLMTMFIATNCRKNTYHKRSKIKKAPLRILYGQDVKDGEFPYVVILIVIHPRLMQRTCTASMLNEEWSLTAAHCFDLKILIPFMSIWYGNYTASPLVTKQVRKLLNYYVHPSYRRGFGQFWKQGFFVNNDIALAHTDKIHLTSYGQLSIIEPSVLIGMAVKYVGGGLQTLHYEDKVLNQTLQYGEAIIVKCNWEVFTIPMNIICTASKCSEKLTSPYKGDSGGPLIHDGKIVGGCSFGDITNSTWITAFVPVSPYHDWISDLVQKKDLHETPQTPELD